LLGNQCLGLEGALLGRRKARVQIAGSPEIAGLHAEIDRMGFERRIPGILLDPLGHRRGCQAQAAVGPVCVLPLVEELRLVRVLAARL